MSDPSVRPGKLSVVESSKLLRPLADSDKSEIAEGSVLASAHRGETLFLAGDPAEFVCVVGTGFVKLTKTSATGQEVTVELLGPGQCFGLLAALEGRVFPLGASAVTSCWYLKVPRRIFAGIYGSSEVLKDQIVRTIGPRLRKAHDMMGRLSSGKVGERIAVILLVLSESYGVETGSGLRLEVPLTRQDIAEMAGTTVETTIRILSRWQKEGLISTDKHILTLHDPEALIQKA